MTPTPMPVWLTEGVPTEERAPLFSLAAAGAGPARWGDLLYFCLHLVRLTLALTLFILVLVALVWLLQRGNLHSAGPAAWLRGLLTVWDLVSVLYWGRTLV